MKSVSVKKRKKISPGSLLFDLVIYVALIGLFVITFYPMWYVVVASFASSKEVALSYGLMLWPKDIVLGAYKLVFSNMRMMRGLFNTVKILAISLPINLIMTMLCGYFLSCTNMLWKKPIAALILLTMYFGGGLVPNYLNVKELGLFNTHWALILPGCLSVYNSIICKTAIEGIPHSLVESAYIDGASDFQVMWKIITPLIKPTMAVLCLYYGVATWNSWFNASIYLTNEALYPMQYVLQQLLRAGSQLAQNVAAGDDFDQYAETIKYAAIVVGTVPIICVYPFLQKHFAKGVMIGAVKG